MSRFEVYMKILNIYTQLFIKANSPQVTNHSKKLSEEVHKLYIEYLKLYVMLTSSKPSFEEDLYKYDHCNCYCYALGLKCPDAFSTLFYEINGSMFVQKDGFLALKDKTDDKREILNNIYDDLEVLNYQIYETDKSSPLKHDGYKIAIYFNNPLSDYGDFHVSRENIDGSWSEKIGYLDDIRKFSDPDKTYYERFGYEVNNYLEIVKPTIKEDNITLRRVL